MAGPVSLGIEGIGPAVSLARGGSAEVFQAEQLAFGRTVAIKVIFAPTTDSGAYARFERECLALGAVSSHPHIVVVHDRGLTTDDRPYIIMEYRAGGSLADRLFAEGKLPLDEVIDIGIKITDALALAHDAGVLHRDVKPANILLSAYGEPALADFGIARIDGGHRTTTGTFSASVAHAGREILAGESPSERSDLYAIGSTLFELATGSGPYTQPGDDSVWQMINRIMTELPPDPGAAGIPQPLAAIIARLLSPDPNERYSSARVLHGDLVATKDRPVDAASDLGLFDPLDPPPTIGEPLGPMPISALAAATVEATTGPPTLEANVLPPQSREGSPEPAPASSAPEDARADTQPPPSRRRRVAAIAAVLVAIASLGAAGWFFGNAGEEPEERPQIDFEDALIGPLLTETSYEIGVSWPELASSDREPDTTYQLLVGDVPATEPSDQTPVWVPSEGRHQIVIEVTTDGASTQTDPLEVYVSDGPPLSGFRVNLASVTASPDQWRRALGEFDRLVSDGHTDVELSLSARGEFWNFYIDGYGSNRAEAEAYCASFELGPDDCFVASVGDPSE